MTQERCPSCNLAFHWGDACRPYGSAAPSADAR